jgi:hypothetical protein
MVDAVYKSKLFIESLYLDSRERKWFKSVSLDSFEDEKNRVEFYVFEGSPPRGFIIANYAVGSVYAYDMNMKHRMTTRVL